MFYRSFGNFTELNRTVTCTVLKANANDRSKSATMDFVGLDMTMSDSSTKHDAGRQRPVSSPSLKESILNVMAVRPESSTRAVAHHVRVNHQTFCRVLKENQLHLFHFQRVQALNPAYYLIRLPVDFTSM
ncbi:hypothetical protein TNCV_1069061 [Trichonephila clavipes]|nr:hypothetical protein TNCV_1069061 [Trichonephila clavipes]